MSKRPALTPEILRTLQFQLALHMRMDKSSVRSVVNEEYGLVINVEVRRKDYKILRQELEADQIDVHVDLLASNPDRVDQLHRFCAAYNDHHGLKP